MEKARHFRDKFWLYIVTDAGADALQLYCIQNRAARFRVGEDIFVTQAYQFALDTVRLTERQRNPDLSPDELAWRVTRRMQGNPNLGR